MIIYIKKYFENCDPNITEWDKPRERKFKGKVVKVWSVPAPEFYEEEDLDIPSTVEEDF